MGNLTMRDMNNEEKSEKKNVMLLCLSTLSWRGSENRYTYKFKDEMYSLTGYMTNEAPVKRIIEQLKMDKGKRLDRIVMICSDTTEKKKTGETNPPEKESDWELYRKKQSRCLGNGKPVFDMTHADYFEEVIKEFSEQTDACYQEEPVKFYRVGISDFSNEMDVINAVVQSANEVMKEFADIDLYIDFNGGPRNVAVLILGIANLMKLRNVNIREISTMDFENKKDGIVPIENMDAVFGSVDLVAGINEYINYGRIHILKRYFEKCQNPRIQMILHNLENFANNMQLCAIDYVMKNKENLKKDLNEYLRGRKGKSAEDVYELMFSFVAEDILRGCRPLLEGDLPEMIQWCVDREFIQQAMIFYTECMPEYFHRKHIFGPTREEREEFNGWQADCELKRYVPEDILKDYREKYIFMNHEYCWMNYYLQKIRPVLNMDDTMVIGTAEMSDTADVPDIAELSGMVDMGKPEDYDICKIIGNQIDGAIEEARFLIGSLREGSKCAESSVDSWELRQILVEYFAIRRQSERREQRIVKLGDKGMLWSYQEMCSVLRAVSERLYRLK